MKRKWTIRKAIENSDALQLGDWIKGCGDLDSHHVLCMTQTICKAIQAEIKHLQAIAPRTADGVEVGPGDKVWLKPGTNEYDDGAVVCAPFANDETGYRRVARCYSTQKAAEAAGGK